MKKWIIALALYSAAASMLAFYFAARTVSMKRVLLSESGRLRNASAFVDEVSASLEDRLHEIYPGLRRIGPGPNRADGNGIYTFEIQGSNVALRIENTSAEPMKPNVSIVLFNRVGFVVGFIREDWMFASVSPGERRIEYETIKTNFGDAVYFLCNTNF